jgi:hypothetical protein
LALQEETHRLNVRSSNAADTILRIFNFILVKGKNIQLASMLFFNNRIFRISWAIDVRFT